jgi:protocatechuate 3,4-dioxygenase beta subunit
MSKDSENTKTRREAMGLFGAVGLAALVGCGKDEGAGVVIDGGADAATDPIDTAPDAGDALLDASSEADALIPSCVLTPEQTTGPYYVSLLDIRSDITSGTADGGKSEGIPLQLQITIVDAKTCAPIQNAAVDIWHCDARGYYSQFEENNPDVPFGPGASTTPTGPDTFLRGVQLTDTAGLAAFTSVYPGFYAGRAIHIHVEVHVQGSASASKYSGGHVAHVGQIFFDESVSDDVMKEPAYAGRAITRTLQKTDHIFAQGGGTGLVTLTPLTPGSAAGGYRASIVLGIDPQRSV